MTKLWIDNNLVIRHSEKGWPVEPQMSFGDYNPEEQKIYLDELAQAKAESLPFEDHNAVLKLVYANKDKNGISILTSMYADTFIEIAGEVEVVEIPCESVYDDFKCIICGADPFSDGHTRKVARLKPASSAMSFAEPITITELGWIKNDGLKHLILKEFEKLMGTRPNSVSSLNEALNNLGIK